jgi:PBSX family phage terminase large subunit
MSEMYSFNEKQVGYIEKTARAWFNVLEGGKRGGKNVVNTLAWAIEVDGHEDKLHLAAGVSVASAKLNIIDSNGLGFLYYFAGRYKQGKYQDRDCVSVETPKGKKVILISGGGKKGDEKLIKGNSYGTALITEANECSKDFIKEVFDRTMSSKRRKVFHDLNPKSPKHWYYEEIVGYHARQQEANNKYGFNYEHFTIADNLSLTTKEKRRILGTYDRDSIWYKRDIEGRRIAAEGGIYPLFASNPERYIIEKEPEIMTAAIGVDFGGSRSGQAFVCVGFTRGYREAIILDEEYRRGTLDNPNSLAIAFSNFCLRNKRKYAIRNAFADSAEQVLIRGLEARVRQDMAGILLNNALKTKVIDRIRLENMLFGTDRLKIMKHCKVAREGFENAVWNGKAEEDERLDDFTSNIDILDATEYALEPFVRELNVGAKVFNKEGE